MFFWVGEIDDNDEDDDNEDKADNDLNLIKFDYYFNFFV